MAACLQALQWQAQLEPQEIIKQGAAVITQLELANTKLRESGRCANSLQEPWKNSLLLQELLAASGHRDVGFAELFCKGA